jgi:hypothetical protein
MCDLERDFLLNFGGHKTRRKGSRAKGESPMDSRTSSTTRVLHRYGTTRRTLSKFFLHHCIGLKSSPLSLPILAQQHKSIEASASKLPANEAAKKQFARTLPQLCDYSLTEKIRRVHSPQRGEKRAAQTSTLPPTQRHIIFLAHDVTRNFLKKQPDAVCELRVIVYN